MAGNVWEWVADRYGPYPPGGQQDPRGPATGEQRIHRDGGWNSRPATLRATERAHVNSFYTNTAVGFRVARSAE